MTEDEQSRQTEDTPEQVCPGCARPIPEEADFCPLCGAPVGPTVWFDPFKNIYAEGYVNRRLTGGTPRRWTIMAEICLTALVLLVLGIFIAQVDTLKDAIWMGVSIAIGAGFLYRLVKNYRDTAPKAEDEDAQQGGGTVR